MKARKQISIEQLFRLYPQLRADDYSVAEPTNDERSICDTRSPHGPEELARETCMEV